MSYFYYEIIYMVPYSAVDEILYKKVSFLHNFLKTHFEHNRNSVENQVHELKNIKSFSSLEHSPKSNKSASAFLKLCFHVCFTIMFKSANEIFFSIFIVLNSKWVPRFKTRSHTTCISLNF